MSATESTQSRDAKDSGMAAKDPAKRRRALLIVALIFIGAGVLWYQVGS